MGALRRLKKKVEAKRKRFPSLAKRIEAELTRHRNISDKKCIICGDTPTTVDSIFTIDPEVAHEFGGIPGRGRYLFYSLCPSCFTGPKEKVALAAEEKIKDRINDNINSVGDAIHGQPCAACGGVPDMVHLLNDKVYTTCLHCRETKKNLCEFLSEKLSAPSSKPGE